METARNDQGKRGSPRPSGRPSRWPGLGPRS